MSQIKPQRSPDDFHDAVEHKYQPNKKGVCKKCGWWNPNGNICPHCGGSFDKEGKCKKCNWQNPYTRCPKCGRLLKDHSTALVIEIKVKIRPENEIERRAKKAHLN